MTASRRAEPRFRLVGSLELLPDADGGGVLAGARPLVALRLNRRAFALVSGTRRWAAPSEVAAAVPGATLGPTRAFLERCAARGLLERRPPPDPGEPATVSVVVPSHGRPEGARAAVEALRALDWPRERLELIVVDDVSPTPLAGALEELGARVLRMPGATPHGPAAARNAGAREASGEWLAFVDDDVLVDPGWLRAFAPHLAELRVAAVGGRVGAVPEAGWVAAFEAVRSPLDMGPRGGDVGPGRPVAYLPTCNLLVRRSAFTALGGFDAAMRVGEDVDFVWRLARTGRTVRYAPEATVRHRHRTRLGSLLRRRAQYASSEAELVARHPGGRRRLVLPPLVLAALLALVALPVAPPAAAVALVATAVAWAAEVGHKVRRLRALGLHGHRPSGPRATVGAVAWGSLRAHGAAFHHLGAHLVRYHGIPLTALALAFPPLALAWAPLALVPAVVDHRRLRPRLPLVLYVVLWWLEMAAYQAGVAWGALRRRDPRALFPRIEASAVRG